MKHPDCAAYPAAKAAADEAAATLKAITAADVVREAGLYRIPEDIYHADPTETGSLSVSRAKTLLTEGGPAKYRHMVTAPQESRDVFDFGRAAHEIVLGGGSEVAVLDYPDWRSAKARAERDSARSDGKTTILATQWAQVQGMAEALASHEMALDILTSGESEVSAFATTGGVMIRGRFDHLAPGIRIGDYKTTADASPARFARSAWDYGYHIQAAWYRELARLLDLGDLPFVLVAQEKTAPYLVSVFELDATYLDAGCAAMRDAIAIYRECLSSGEWPGYSPNIVTLSPPQWARYEAPSQPHFTPDIFNLGGRS